uniref:Uncharacterized protein n=2 Tax=Picea TaxID=3328 RepID=A0A117NG81_PICGL|nr:hypothetical protein ABT39_MTgene1486 [Picea glauca]QHR92666.1 hypothetical protein Q903MT_gene6714 [Picea sitchensis]
MLVLPDSSGRAQDTIQSYLLLEKEHEEPFFSFSACYPPIDTQPY